VGGSAKKGETGGLFTGGGGRRKTPFRSQRKGNLSLQPRRHLGGFLTGERGGRNYLVYEASRSSASQRGYQEEKKREGGERSNGSSLKGGG